MTVLGTHPVENLCPALQSDTLEHSQHGQDEVVKVCDPKVGSDPILPTDLPPALVTLEASPTGPEKQNKNTFQ